ncbi:MAG: hypothetical protein ACFB01_17480 [Cohaesibacteraceae bacterium]
MGTLYLESKGVGFEGSPVDHLYLVYRAHDGQPYEEWEWFGAFSETLRAQLLGMS